MSYDTEKSIADELLALVDEIESLHNRKNWLHRAAVKYRERGQYDKERATRGWRSFCNEIVTTVAKAQRFDPKSVPASVKDMMAKMLEKQYRPRPIVNKGTMV